MIPLGVEPNGLNINDGVGSTALEAIRAKVVEEGADIGLALDGDADRLIVIDEKGRPVDGDQLMALIGSRLAEEGSLAGGGVVATIMSNLGLERFLESRGLDLVRTRVGDRYVLEAMRRGGYNVGGEQSGHMILLDHATTGDGTIAALQVLAALVNRASARASCCICSTRCRNCFETCASREGAAIRSSRCRSNGRSRRAKANSAAAGAW